MGYKGISKKKLKDGSDAIMVRFKYLGKIYPIKNFTKLFSCSTEKQAFDKLQEVKLSIRNNHDPFNPQGKRLNDYFYKRYDENIANGVWKKNTTAKQSKNYYETVIKKPLGHKKLNKITYSNLSDILKSLSHTKGMYRNNLKRILNPIFREAIKRGELDKNIIELIETEKVDKMQKLTLRAIDNNLVIVKKLYNAIGEYEAQYNYLKGEINIFLYLILLSAHRYGELIQLTKEDVYIDRDLIISPANITKTKEDYHFPIPTECLEYIKSVKSGLLFPSLKYSAIYGIFQRLVVNAGIKLYKGKKLTVHDTRSLMLNIMIRHCKVDSMLADTCLDHKQSGVVEHYLDFTFKDKKKAFKKYWKKVQT
ncbi:MAG: tyrosine-type recombinase/integrase [Arcobacteraceae bacterium]|nr:tyrosine-type recombinase/integrase [Arcobacteraceae bacterium]